MVIKILVLFGTMFLLMMIGSPIAVALGVATMVTMTATTNISLTTMSTVFPLSHKSSVTSPPSLNTGKFRPIRFSGYSDSSFL